MIKLIITDFDGTLADTFEANLKAYQRAFSDVGYSLDSELYRRCFGLRFDRFMDLAEIFNQEIRRQIRDLKQIYYRQNFGLVRVNVALLELIRTLREKGCKTAVASTARRENILSLLGYLGLIEDFDLIFTGEDVKQGKPNPEIYVKVLDSLGELAENTLIFEDSAVGEEAARAAGINCIMVKKWN